MSNISTLDTSFQLKYEFAKSQHCLTDDSCSKVPEHPETHYRREFMNVRMYVEQLCIGVLLSNN